MNIKNIVVVLAIAFLLTACNPFIQEDITGCTEIGCSDGISLSLNNSLPTTVVIEISFGETTKTLTCAQGECIGKHAFIYGITPEEFSLKITDGSTVLHESTHKPTYTINEPNGPDCPPDCKQTEISIVI